MKKNDMMRKLIISSPMSVSELAASLGVSRFIIHKWKSGESNPRKENVNALANLNSIPIRWMSDTEVEYVVKRNNHESDFELSKSTYNDIIDNQTDLINRLKNDIIRLQNNSQKFRQSRKIVNNHDYSIKCSIKPFKIIEVSSVPEDGLLGYSKNEFISNVKSFLQNPMIDKNFRQSMVDDIIERCNHAVELQLEHFDLTDYLEVIHKNKKHKSWVCYVGFYDLTLNESIYYARILDSSSPESIIIPRA